MCSVGGGGFGTATARVRGVRVFRRRAVVLGPYGRGPREVTVQVPACVCSQARGPLGGVCGACGRAILTREERRGGA